jgi:hypothetical protein
MTTNTDDLPEGFPNTVQLTEGERNLLWEMHHDDQELVYEEGAGWWLDLNYVSARTCWSLLKKMLIKDVTDTNGVLRRYIINESGERALNGETPVYST